MSASARVSKIASPDGQDDLVERLNKIRERAPQQQGDFLEGEGTSLPSPSAAGTSTAITSAHKSLVRASKHLPMWAENERAGPNVLMRSSIFGIAPPRTKRWVAGASEPREVVALGDIQISMIGEELRQEDGDVLFGILHLARVTSRHGGVVDFTAADFIRELAVCRT